MKKLTALLLALLMTLTMVLAACGDGEEASTGPEDTRQAEESKPAEESSTSGTETQPGEDTASDSQTSGNTEQTSGEEPKPGVAPEPVNQDDYTKVTASPAILEYALNFAGQFMGLFDQKVDFSDASAFRAEYGKSEPVYIYDPASETFIPANRTQEITVDVDFDKFNFLCNVNTTDDIGNADTLSIYLAESEELGKALVISAPSTLTKNVVIDGQSFLKIVKMALAFATGYIDSITAEGEEEDYAPMLDTSEEDGIGVLLSGDEEGGFSLPFITVDDEGNVQIDPTFIQAVTAIINVLTDGETLNALRTSFSYIATDFLKLFLPRDDSLQKVAYNTQSGNSVSAEMATININGIFGKMMLLALANRLEEAEFAVSYGKIRSAMPDEIKQYMPDIDTVCVMLRAIAEEIGANKGIVINRYIVDGVSICDEIVADGAIVERVRELLDRMNESGEEWEEDQEWDEETYGEWTDDETDGEGSEDVYYEGEDTEGEDVESWPQIVDYTFALEYYNGAGRYIEVERYDDGSVFYATDVRFNVVDNVFSILSGSEDCYDLLKATFNHNNLVIEKSTRNGTDCNTEKYDLRILNETEREIGFSAVATRTYHWEYVPVDDEGNEGETEIEEGESSESIFFRLSAIDSFTTPLPAEVNENKYDLTNVGGLIEIYSDLYVKYGYLFDAIFNRFSGGSEEYEES